MRTMSGSPCLHYDCSNRNSFGYCKTTVCINEHYQQEQWGFPLTTNKSESAVIKPQTNADRIRAMTDEELAAFMFTANGCPMWVSDYSCKEDKGCRGASGACWLDWLKEEATE